LRLSDKSGLRIIDSHVHITTVVPEYLSGEDLAPETLDNVLAENFVESALVSNLSGLATWNNLPGGTFLQDETETNEALIEICRKYERFKPLAVCQPGKGDPANIETLLSRNTFYGLKFHPHFLDLEADSRLYNPYMEIAGTHNLTCVFHSAAGKSDPGYIYRLAKRHKDVPVVLYHINLCGDLQHGIDLVKKSMERQDANLYLEISWVSLNTPPDKPNWLAKAINAVGKDRILFGTDASLGEFGRTVNGVFTGTDFYTSRVRNIKNIIKAHYPPETAADITDSLFYSNSKALFFPSMN
jgi:predicted TIM-barrel fold metal-dependent hydrolase